MHVCVCLKLIEYVKLTGQGTLGIQPSGKEAASWLAFFLFFFLNHGFYFGRLTFPLQEQTTLSPQPFTASYKVATLKCPSWSPPQTLSAQHITEGKTSSEVGRFPSGASSVAGELWDSNDRSLN